MQYRWHSAQGYGVEVLIRPVQRPLDLEALDRLFETIHECDGHAPIGEHKYLDLFHSSPERDSGLVAEVDGVPVAYVAIGPTQDPNTWAMEVAVHPLHRDRDTTRGVVGAGTTKAAAHGAERVRCWAFQPNLVAALEQAGFEPERELRQLRVDLPLPEEPALPGDIEIRPFRIGTDEDLWLRVNNRAFAGHPENGSWTRAVLEDRQAQPWFDSAGFRMAWQRADLVGFCWTKVHDDGVGEIYVIGVDSRKQGSGLGQALVLEGLRFLHEERAVSRGMLYVDADNERALRLYHRLGFRLDHVDRSLVLEIGR